jgi:ribonucleoside-diphosphate reductase alpha chain
MNAGTEMGQLSACFLIPVEDNLSAIMEAVKQTALIHKSGGGTGIVFSHIRPSGSIVNTTTGVASGPVSFMKIFDATTGVIKQGGKRRGANIGILSCNHPDILNFIRCKEDTKQYTNFNISVSITDNFMKAVRADNGYPLVNPFSKEKTYIKANEIFHALCEQAWKTGEPGIIFIDTINKTNPVPEFGRIEGTNPCVAGDTLIAVADGRGAVSIKQLVEEGKDVPVYCADSDGRMHIRYARKPRLTGKKKEIYKVNLDDGTSIRATGNHKFVLRGGENKRVDKLAVGDSLLRFDKYQFSYGHKDEKYWGVQKARRGTYQEHRMFKEFQLGRYLDKNEQVHHKNWNGLDNLWDNLKEVTATEHKTEYHDISGDNNPVRRFPECNIFNNQKWQQEMREKHHIGKKRSKKTRELLSQVMPIVMSNPDVKEKISNSLIEYYKDIKIPTEKRICKWCNGDFEVKENSKAMFCSKSCSISRSNTLRKKNHKVVSVEFAGFEDVYNMTVDEFHNYAVITDDASENKSGIIVKNCGEQPLLFWESCNLGSINLAKMVNKGKVDWNRLSNVVEIATRFLDDVIDVNKFPNVKIARKTKTTRKIGLGVMGWADMLIDLGIRYDGEEALDLARRVMRSISEDSYKASKEIGKEKGYCLDRLKRRNSVTTTIAPTGTLSLLAGCSSSIEPIFAKEYTKTVMDGVKLDLSKHKDVSSDVLVTAHDIPIEKHIAMQSAFQEFVDNAVSKTVNLPKTAKVATVAKAFIDAHSQGCKGITVYREGSREGPMAIVDDKNALSECDDGKCQI